MGRFAIATSGGEASDAADSVAQREPRREGITGAEGRHVVFPDVPCGGHEGGEQPSGEHSSGLERIDAEDFRGMGGVISPLVDDVEDLGAQDAAKDYENAKIPGMIAVVSEPLRVADTDPKAEQDSYRDQESVGRQEEPSNMKKLWEHWLIRCASDVSRYFIQFSSSLWVDLLIRAVEVRTAQRACPAWFVEV